MDDHFVYFFLKELRQILQKKSLSAICKDDEKNVLISFHDEGHLVFFSRCQDMNLLWTLNNNVVGESACIMSFKPPLTELTISSIPGDRCFSIKGKLIHPFKKAIEISLFFEIFGRFNNLILTRDNRIIWFLNENRQKNRKTLIGEIYEPPLHTRKPVITRWKELSEEFMENEGERKVLLRSFLKKNFSLMSSNTIEEIFSLCRMPINISMSEVDTDIISEVADKWKKIRYNPGYITRNGRKELISFKPCSESLKAYEYTKTDTLYEAIKTILEDSCSGNLLHKYRQKILSQYTNKLENLEASLKKLRDILEKCSNPEQLKTTGQYLLQFGDQIKKTDKGYLIPVEPAIEVPAKPNQTQVQLSQEYFREYKKAKRAIEPLNKQIKSQEEKIAEIRKEIAFWENCNDINQFIMKMRINSKKLKDKVLPFRKFRSPSGYPILVGRDDKENSQLSLKYAAPSDIWFHTKAIPGSHVIIILPNKSAKITEYDLLVASRIAITFSKVKNSLHVPVDYTLVKYLRAVKGIPGKVTYSREKTIITDPFSKEELQEYIWQEN
ncbi:MAG: NFACT family protein [Candidatus Coatesbacteria bacterium]|nr:NFACT family protein [Candidatus Coatesbacteria bacterium]